MGLAPKLDNYVKERIIEIRSLITDSIEEQLFKSYMECLIYGKSELKIKLKDSDDGRR